jgi:putative endonuclease
MFYLYILHSSASDKYYVGHSEDPWLRLEHHNTDDKDTYTSKHRPWFLAAIFEAGTTRSKAFIMNSSSRSKNQEA